MVSYNIWSIPYTPTMVLLIGKMMINQCFFLWFQLWLDDFPSYVGWGLQLWDVEPPSPLPGCLGGGHRKTTWAQRFHENMGARLKVEPKIIQNPIVYHHFKRNLITIFLDKRWVDVLFRQTIVCPPTMSWWQHEWEYNLTLFLRLIRYGWGPPGWDTIGSLVWSRFTTNGVEIHSTASHTGWFGVGFEQSENLALIGMPSDARLLRLLGNRMVTSR